MTKYHVEFSIVSDDSWESKSDNLQQLVTSEGSVVVPSYATITEVTTPFYDGYYVMPEVLGVYRKYGDTWTKRNAKGEWLCETYITDEYMRDCEAQFLADITKKAR